MSRIFRVLSLVFVFVTVAFTTPLFAVIGGFNLTKLVSDQPNTALITDLNLVNAWGIAVSPSSPFWVSDNGTDVSTIYGGDVAGSSFATNSLVVTIPTGANTGVVFNGTSDFVVTSGGSGPARFIFATESGTIVGWSPNVPAAGSTTGTLAATVVNAVYKGIALGNNGVANFLYAANFHSGAIDVFNNVYAPATLAGSFIDPALPAGYAPFNIQNLGGTLYVTYAKQDGAMHDEVDGPGFGYVSKFDLNGNFLMRLVSNGPLNAPWGMAIAPAGFTPFGSALLVGNFGDGTINAFNPTTGALLGTLSDSLGTPIAIDGLWGLTFGNGGGGGDTNTLYFAAGPNSEADGLFGKLTVNAAANTITAVATNFNAVEGASFSGTVASFSDADGSGTYTTTINWGDATTSAGTVVPLGGGNFAVQGTHTYAEENVAGATVTVAITDTSDSGTATVSGKAFVADAALHATGTTVSPIATVPFSGVVASFTDDNPAATASDFTATIDWGDATATSPGVITSNGGGGFSVSGSHTYATQSGFTITVTINDIGGSTATATSTANANSASAAPLFSLMTLLLLAGALLTIGFTLLRRT